MAGSSLGQLAGVVGAELIGDPTTMVTDVTHDSRRVIDGSLFVAVRGATTDGHGFVTGAVADGASAVCVEEKMEVQAPQLVVPNTRRAMGPLAARVHGDPSRSMSVVGVTGTNGKTTTTHFIESIALSSDLFCGLIGTIQTRGGGRVFESDRTTPESSDFQRLLASMRDEGCSMVATEVSSHALTLDRVRGTRFEVAAFTNLSQDHLDFHHDMYEYRESKKTLFYDYEVGTSVVNIDDPVGLEMVEAATSPVITVGSGGDSSVSGIGSTATGTGFRLTTPWGSGDIDAPLVGRFNVDNAVMAATCCLAAGLSFDQVVNGLSGLSPVPGRFEVVSGADPVTVIVDYAHTPEGVRLATETGRTLGDHRLITLIGAGGDRDEIKRGLMGGAASGADLVIVTSDNPRSENPDRIAAQVAEGVPGDKRIVEVDRSQAIARAIGEAEPGDVVLILGRGHEPFQEIAGVRIPFDDREVAREALFRLRSSAKNDVEYGSMER